MTTRWHTPLDKYNADDKHQSNISPLAPDAYL